MSPRHPSAIRILEPKAVVGDVEVAVVVDIAESGSFTGAGAGDDADSARSFGSFRPFSNRRLSAGDSVSEFTAEITVEIAMVSANCL